MERTNECVQCGRCSSGCPVAFESPHSPRRIIRLLQLGRIREAAQSPFVWLCATCQACAVRCPRGVQVLEVMLALRREGQEQGWVRPPVFYRTFKQMIDQRGRVTEWQLGIKIAFRKFSLHPLADAMLFFKLWRRGKIR